MTYGFGLTIETYRGMRLVQHIGSTGGYRAAIYRFPDAHTSVAMLCNVSTANTGQLALRMSDAVLGGRFGAPPERVAGAGRAADRGAAESSGTPHVSPLRDAALGRYRSDELLGAVWDITAGDAPDRIAVQRARNASELFVADEKGLSFSSHGITLLFDPPARGKSPGFVVNGNRVSGLRFERALP